jgi:hypothetical protein
MSEQIGLWMYAIIENKNLDKIAKDLMGIHGTSSVYIVPFEDFATVVSQEPMKKYPLMRDYLVAHELVCEKVMQTHRVLPVRFCTIAENEDKIINEVLKVKKEEFTQRFLEIKNCDEYGLRVRWKDVDKVFREIGETDEKINNMKTKILNLPELEKRNMLIEIGHVVQKAIQEKNTKLGDSLIAEFSNLAKKTKKNNILGDMNILNAAFLVNKEKQTLVDKAINNLGAQYEKDLYFKYVGPVPPFNFVEIVIKWEDTNVSIR